VMKRREVFVWQLDPNQGHECLRPHQPRDVSTLSSAEKRAISELSAMSKTQCNRIRNLVE
jgi:hypothetical protein